MTNTDFTQDVQIRQLQSRTLDQVAELQALYNSIGAIEATAPQLVTALPGTPVDKQTVYYLVNDAGGVIWTLRYREIVLAWEFVGGSPLTAVMTNPETPLTTLSTTYQSVAGAAVTIPRAGTYMVTVHGQTGLHTGITITGPGVAAEDTRALLAIEAQIQASAGPLPFTFTGSGSVQLMYRSLFGTNQGAISRGRVAVTPVKLT